MVLNLLSDFVGSGDSGGPKGRVAVPLPVPALAGGSGMADVCLKPAGSGVAGVVGAAAAGDRAGALAGLRRA